MMGAVEYGVAVDSLHDDSIVFMELFGSRLRGLKDARHNR
jgi:hypothetical protein